MADYYADQTAAILRVNLFENPPRDKHPTHSNATVKIKERTIIEPGVYRSTLWKNEAYLSFTLEEKIAEAPGDQPQAQPQTQPQTGGSDDPAPIPF